MGSCMWPSVFWREDLDQSRMNNFYSVCVESFVMEVLVKQELCFLGTHIEL